MSFFNLTIKSRLYFGFAAIVLFGLALSVFSGWQFMRVESDVATMGALSNGAVRAREISEHIQAVRRALLQYMHDGDQAAFKESADRGAKAMELLKQAAVAAAGRPDRLAAYQGLQKSVERTGGQTGRAWKGCRTEGSRPGSSLRRRRRIHRRQSKAGPGGARHRRSRDDSRRGERRNGRAVDAHRQLAIPRH